MVTDRKKHSGKTPVEQGPEEIAPDPDKINASTPCDFNGGSLTPYGGLLPIIATPEKLGFRSLVEQAVTSKRIPRAMDLYRFVLGIVLGLYIRLWRPRASASCSVAARIWRHAGRTGVNYSDHYAEKGVFEPLMDRLCRIAPRGESYAPVMVPALR